MELILTKKITQEHPMGCGVACVATRCRITYAQALKLFAEKEWAWTRGIYCKEMVAALAKAGYSYEWKAYDSKRHEEWLEKPGTIIFIKRSAQYPSGHYIVRVKGGWMNPWSNFPLMNPPKSAIQKKFPGEIEFIIFEPHTLTAST
jgi:hypothetical protein